MQIIDGAEHGLGWLLALWAGASISWLCTSRAASGTQRGLRAVALLLALATLAQGAAAPIVIPLMLSIVLATVASWIGAASAPRADAHRSRER